MTTTAFAAHRLMSSLPLTSLPDLVGSASFAAPCLDDHGRDLVFSALRNPEWKTARSQKQPAQNALLQWLDRRDVDPFAPQLLVNPNAKAKKGAAPTKAYATSFQLAMDMGLESLAVGMLSCAAVTPARLEVLRSSELGQDLLEKALAKNMTALVAKAAESGWDLLRRDAQGRSLLWQARSLEAVNALLEAGLPVDRLAEPGVLEALGKSLPRKDAQAWLALVESHSSTPSSLVGQKLAALLEDLQGSTPERVWERGGAALVKNLEADRCRLQDFLTQALPELSQAKVHESRGMFKGELTAVALLARFASRDPLRPTVSGLVYGMEAQVFAGPPQVVRPGVTDLGLFALCSPCLEEIDNELQNASSSAEQAWWTQCLEGHQAILALHRPEQWLEWKTETAATLSKKPTAIVVGELGYWMSQMARRVDANETCLETIGQVLNELEHALSHGVAFVGSGSTRDVDTWLQCIEPTVENAGRYETLVAQRDRLVLAILGNEARYASSLQTWGRHPSSPWSDADHEENRFTLFTPESLARVWDNPRLESHVKRGLERALELNAPNTQALKKALLEGRLKPAQPDASPRPRL